MCGYVCTEMMLHYIRTLTQFYYVNTPTLMCTLYACVYVYAYIHKYICTYTNTHTHIHAHTHACTHANTHTHNKHANTHTHEHTHSQESYSNIQGLQCKHQKNIYTHIHVHTYTYTHTHTRTTHTSLIIYNTSSLSDDLIPCTIIMSQWVTRITILLMYTHVHMMMYCITQNFGGVKLR